MLILFIVTDKIYSPMEDRVHNDAQKSTLK